MAAKPPPPLDRSALYAAALVLAERLDYDDATLAQAARASKVPLARLRAQYIDFQHYLIALQQHFLDELRDAVIAVTSLHPPGLDRVRGATTVYLDHCLKRRALRDWFLRARRAEPAVAEGLRRQNQAFVLIISTEFHALGWPYPQAAARLFLAAIQEAARLEHQQRQPLPHLRSAIWEIARHYAGAQRTAK